MDVSKLSNAGAVAERARERRFKKPAMIYKLYKTALQSLYGCKVVLLPTNCADIIFLFS
jgi:hypothetical protein